jgi:hypothetical protein
MVKELKTNLNYDSEGSEDERDVATDTVAESDHQFDSSDDVALTRYSVMTIMGLSGSFLTSAVSYVSFTSEV